jgi:carboxypeptidase PM20D1
LSRSFPDRLHPADSCRRVLDSDRAITNDDRLVARILTCSEPSGVSPYGKDVYAYRVLEQTIRQTYEHGGKPIIVVPGLMLGATDSRSYTNLTRNLYRFSPFVYRHDDLNRLHGDNERIRHKDVQRGLNFYFHLIVNNQLERLPEPQFKSEF